MGLLKSIGRGIGRLVRPAARVAAVAGVPGAGMVSTALAGRSGPPAIPAIPRALSGGGVQTTGQRQPGVAGAVRRALPGGRSGYAYDKYDLDTPVDRTGRPVAVHMETRERVSCPPGYVGVDLDGDGVKDACVLKGVARAMGLYKSRPKPLVSGYETRALTVAANVKGRVASVARKAGLYVAAKKPQPTGGKKK